MHPRGGHGDDTRGVFVIPSKVDGQPLAVIASSDPDLGWDHVSVSRSNRTPTWGEMEQIKRLFFRDDECVMQLHPPIADYVDGTAFGHVNCLHLWRPTDVEIPRPPQFMVGGMPLTEADAAYDAEVARRRKSGT